MLRCGLFQPVPGVHARQMQRMQTRFAMTKRSAHRQQATPEPGAEVDVVVQLEGSDTDCIVDRLLCQDDRLQRTAPASADGGNTTDHANTW